MHSQFGIVAFVRALMVVNKEIWKAFLDYRLSIIKRDAGKRKKREMSADSELKKKQMSAREQCIEIIGEEFTKKWEALPPDLKMVMAGITKTDFTKQTAHINNFNVESGHPKKQAPLKKQAPQQQAQTKSFPSQSEFACSQSQTASQRTEQQQNTPNAVPFKNRKQDSAPKKQFQGHNKSNYTPPSSRQQKQFFKQFDNKNSRRQAYKSGGEVDPYSPDFAPMNIFENQVVPTGIHNLSKIFRPNLATIRVLSLGMKFIPKSATLKWKNIFSNFENFRQRMNNKMFFFVENSPGTFVRDKTFRMKS